MSDPAGSGTWPIAVAGGAGGAYIAWLVDGQTHIPAQRVNSSGSPLWGTYGVSVMTTANVNGFGATKWTDLVRTSMGVIVSWGDDRNGVSNANIFAQHLSSVTGDIWAGWPDQGVRICSHFSYQPRAVSDLSSGAVIVWQDQRNSPSEDDIYAQGINPDGTLGDGATGIGDLPQVGASRSPVGVPNPFSSSTLIAYTLDRDGMTTVDVFDIGGRRVFTDRRSAVRGANTYLFGGLSDAGTPLPSGTYFYRVTSGHSTETGRMTIVR